MSITLYIMFLVLLLLYFDTNVKINPPTSITSYQYNNINIDRKHMDIDMSMTL